MRKKERLARLLLLWAGDCDPGAMHLIMSRSNPSRRRMIPMLAKFAQRPDIAAELVRPEVLPFFLEEPGSDALQELRKQQEARRTAAMLGLGALLLGQREQGEGNGYAQ